MSFLLFLAIPDGSGSSSNPDSGDSGNDNNTSSIVAPVPAFPELEDGLIDCYNGPSPDKIKPLDTFYEIPCSISNVPTVDINPDQRDLSFPVITPKLDGVFFNNNKGCKPATIDTVETGTDLGSDNTTNTNVLSDSGWTRPNSTDVGTAQRVTSQTRMAFSTSDGIVAFFRTYSYDSCGQLLSISPETKKTVALAGPC